MSKQKQFRKIVEGLEYVRKCYVKRNGNQYEIIVCIKNKYATGRKYDAVVWMDTLENMTKLCLDPREKAEQDLDNFFQAGYFAYSK